jgi:hypothetical protein
MSCDGGYESGLDNNDVSLMDDTSSKISSPKYASPPLSSSSDTSSAESSINEVLLSVESSLASLSLLLDSSSKLKPDSC